MSKQNLPAVNADTLNEIANGNEAISFEQAMEQMEKADGKGLIEITSEYLVIKKGVSHFAFMGFTQATIDGKDIKCAKLTDKAGNNFIAGDKVLISSCEKLTTIPAYIRIEYTEDKKSGAGSYKDLKVKTFAGATS